MSSFLPLVEPELVGEQGQLRGAAIAAIGTALPATAVPNAPIADRLGCDDAWIVRRTGVRERRMVAEDERLSDLAAAAGRLALERRQLDPQLLDLILVASHTQDELLPNAAPLVAAELGASRAGAIDIGAACTGFLSALELGVAQIEARRANRVLVIGADVLTRFLDFDDRRTAGLIGDGAGAVVLEPTAGPGRCGPCVMGADAAAGADLVYMTRGEQKLRMEGQETYRHAVKRLTEVTEDALVAAELTQADIDLFVYHQANSRILAAVGERLRLDPARVVNCIAPTGNTSAASIPLALQHALDAKRLHPGDRVLLAAIGAGFTFGAMVVEWGSSDDA